jgi:VCBS repeat-containing protein
MSVNSVVTRTLGLFALLFSLSTWAQPYEYHVYIDSDQRSTTGCTVSGGGQTFAGADYRLTATVSGNPPVVTTRTLAACAGGAFAGGNLLASNYPVGLNNGLPLAGGAFADVIELSVARAQLSGVEPQVRIGFGAVSASGSIDVLYTANGQVGGPPMVVGFAALIPTLGFFGALLLALALAALALRALKHNRRLAQMLLVGAFLSAGFAAWAANFIADGQVGDWAGSSPVGMDAIGDSVPSLSATDIVGAFAADENRNLFFRIDVVDAENRPPVAVGDAYTLLEDGVLNIAAPGVLANDSDPDGNPITAQLVTGPTRGTLALNADGSFVYTPNANANGSDSFTYHAFDGQVTSLSPATVTISITAVNDVPVFTVGPNQTVLEDAGAQVVSPWASGIDDGDPEVTQGLSFEVTANSNTALFSAGPAVSATGALSYTPAANANGSATITLRLVDDGGSANGGVDTSATQTFTITVTPVNDAPGFVAGPNQTVNEDAGAQTVPGWATAMNDGDPELTQTLNFTATVTGTTSNLAFSAAPAIDATTGNLTYTAATNSNGVATIEVRLVDDGSGVAPNVNTSAPQTFTITVAGVNDAPSFVVGPDQTVNEDAGAQTVSPWATALDDGDPEVVQALSFTVTNNSNAALFSAGPAISASGVLTYTPAPNANGSATITLRINDDGSNTPPNVNQSPTQSFTITVNAINDAPSFVVGPNQTVAEDAAAQAVSPWATAISPGPADEAGQTVSFAVTGNTNAALFSVLPSVSPTGVLSYTPAADAFGVATITLTLSDNGLGAPPPNSNTSAAQTFTITVTAVNDAPVLTAGATLAYTENQIASAIDTTVSVIDVDNVNLAGATVAITAGFQTGQDVLACGNCAGGISANYVAASGILTLSGAATLGAYQTALRSVTYFNSSDNPNIAPRTITWIGNDGALPSAPVTSTVTVTAVDDAPTAVNDAATVLEDAAATAVAVLANDTDPDAGPISITGVTQPADGTVVITGGGSGLTYQPNANYCNTPPGTTPSTFTYTLNGGSSATVSMTVTCVDDPPIAVNDSATVAEDAGASAIAVLANDTDIDAGPIGISSVTQPANGTVVITGGGSGLTYAPNLNYCNTPPGTTPDTFTYTLTPGGSSATVSIAVTCVDDAPVAVNDTASVVQGSGANAIDVLANDTDVDGGPISVGSVTQPVNGTVAITGGGSGLTYQPNAGYCNDTPPGTPPSTFSYTLTPGGSSATVSVTVICDVPPVAVADAATVVEDSGANAVDVLANDTDVDGGPRAVASVTQPSNGVVVITGGGSGLTYQPNPNYCNAPPGAPLDTFSYTLTPGSSSATVTITVNCVDDPPVAVADSATVVEDSGANAIAVLANDTDVDAGPISIGSVTQPANGTVVITGGGSGLTYAPNPNYCNNPPGGAPDTFSYTLNGGSSATVSVTVTCVDDPPTAVNDNATVAEDSGANPIAVLANDTDIDVGPISVSSVTQPANGTVVITGGGSGLTYAPNLNYCNAPPGTTPDTFTYTLAPGGSTATVSVTVTCVDDPPVAVNDSATVGQNTGANPIPVLANDTDIDVGPISIGAVTQPANGTVAITGGGSGLTYMPTPGYCNNPPGTTPDTFTYTLTPGGSSATVSVVVNCDTPPTAVADSATVIEDAAAAAVAVLANDTDPDGGPISIASVTQPANGTVVITGGGTGLTYQPNPNYCNDPPGTTLDTFTYTLVPGGSTATVSMTVTCVDDLPVAVADAATVVEDSGATAIAVLANDTDVDAGPMTVNSVTQPADATVVITGGGTGLTYQPNANYCNDPPGTTLSTFSYTLNGGSSATVTVTVTCVDDNPVAVADSATVVEDSGASAINVLANDTDPDGGAISVTSVTQPANGTVVITGGGTGVTYAPNANYCNAPPGTTPDTFTYTLTPGGSSATVTISVTCVDDPPVAVADSATVVEDSGANAINVLANDTDPDAGPKSVTSVTQPANGTVVITGGGNGVTYAPIANYCNAPPGTTPDTFTYTLTPGGSSTTVTIAVTCVNDPPIAGTDAFDTIGNTELRVDLAAQASPPNVAETTVGAIGVRGNDSDPVENDPFTVTAIVGCVDLAAPFDCTLASGSLVSMNANGTFSFLPSPTLASGAPTNDSFQYVITDAPTVGVPASATGTVTIAVYDKVWYVQRGASGNGRSDNPLGSFSGINGAGGAGDSDVAGDYIYVLHDATALASSIELEANQHLLGAGVALSIPRNLNGNGSPTLLAVAGTRSPVTSASNTVSIGNAIPVEIRGLSLASTGGNAIDLTAGAAAYTGSTLLTIADNTVSAATAEGIDVNAAGTSTLNLALNNNNITAAGGGIDIARTAGTLNITDFQNLVIPGNTAGTGIRVDGAIFDATPGLPINQVAGGSTTIGQAGNGVSSNGLLLTSVGGDLAFTDLDIVNDAGAGLRVTSTGALNAGAGTGFRIVVAAGVASIDSSGGPAVDVNGASTTLPLSSLRSVNSTTTGVSLVNAFGGAGSTALSVVSAGGAISDPGAASGTAVNISGGNGNITLPVPISNNSGNSIVVSSRTGDTVSFTGAISDTGSGISLTGNTGATINFSGGISASTGANPAFAATGGGTVNVTGTNTLATTTATALNVANTTIGASGMTFRSIDSASASANSAIVLNTTGAGAFSVTGTGAAGSGGTISNKTVDAVQLSATDGLVTLNRMIIQDIGNMAGVSNTVTGHDAIQGLNVNGGLSLTSTTIRRISDNAIHGGDHSNPATSTVWNGLTLSNVTIEDTNRYHVASRGDANNEGSVRIVGLRGTVNVSTSTFRRGAEFLDLFVTAGTLNLDVTGSVFQNSYREFTAGDNSPIASVGNHCIDVVVQGAAAANVTIGDRTAPVEGNSFLNCRLGSVRVLNDNPSTGTSTFIVARNSFSVNDGSSGVFCNPGCASADFDFPMGGVLGWNLGAGDVNTVIENNTFTDVTNASGGVGQLTLISEGGGLHQSLVQGNSFVRPGNAPMLVQSRNIANSRMRLRAINNTVTGGPSLCTTDLSCAGGYTTPGLRTLFDSSHASVMDLTLDNNEFAGHDQGFDPGETVEVRSLAPSGGAVCSNFNNNRADDGYSLEPLAGSISTVGAGTCPVGSPSPNCQAVLGNRNNRGGSNSLLTNPPFVRVVGSAVSVVGAPCAVPSGGPF